MLRLPARSVICAEYLPDIVWKNGAGRTREIAPLPAGPGASDFLWRISVAEIVGNAPFSTFTGIDRTFLVASPGTLHMKIGGSERDAGFGQPLAFPGEAEVSVEALTGPTRNINLMTRRGLCEGSIDVQHQDGPMTIGAPPAVALVLLDGEAWTSDGGRLGPLEFLVLGAGPERPVFRQAVVATVNVRARPSQAAAGQPASRRATPLSVPER